MILESLIQYPAALFAVAVFVLLIWRTPIGVAALLVFYPIQQYVPRLGPGLNAQTILVGTALAMTLLRTGFRLPPIRVSGPVLFFVSVIFMGFAVAQVARTIDDPEFGTVERVMAVKSHLFTAILFFVAYWWGNQLEHRRAMLEGISFGLLLVASATVVDGLFLGGRRAMGVFTNPNYTGAILGIFMIVPVYLFRASDLPRRRKIVHVAIWGVAGLALLFTRSRAGWLAGFLAHTAWLVYENVAVVGLSVAGGTLAATLAYPILPDFVRERIEFTFTGSKTVYAGAESLDGSSGIRIALYRSGFDLFVQSPLWGHGLDSFRYVVKDEGSKYGILKNKTAHSFPLTVMTELGLIGLASLAYLGTMVLLVGRKVWRCRDPDCYLGPALLAVGLAAVVLNLFHTDFLISPASTGYFWAVYGLAARRVYSDA